MLESTCPGQVCTVARALEVVGERRTILVVRDVFLGVSRFDDLVESLGVTRTVPNATSTTSPTRAGRSCP